MHTINKSDFFSLPIYKKRDEILELLKHNQILVVESPTGSGKTTLLPYILYENGYADNRIIGVTQPRRIAAISISQFITHLVGATDNTVAYKIRFEDTTDLTTRIKIMTDGTLLQEIKSDQYFSEYHTLVIDEAHERSVNIDFILGLLKRALAVRTDLKVVISSATINTKTFSRYFNSCPVISVAAKSYPVKIRWVPLVSKDHNYKNTPTVPEHAVAVFDSYYQATHSNSKKKPLFAPQHKKPLSAHGNAVLIFLSGEKNIKDCIEGLRRLPYARNLHVLPLFGRLGKEEQDKVFESVPAQFTKVIVATNIAETSITIADVVAVIDSGLAKINSYSTKSFTSKLEEVPISKASANQRAGRAGRTRPGTCFRLYSKDEYNQRVDFTPEEILRNDLSEVVLRMAEIGIKDFLSFNFLSSPGTSYIRAAIDTLRRLGAFDRTHSLTKIGKSMTHFPLLPRHSRILIEAMHNYTTVIKECASIIAFLNTNSPFLYNADEEKSTKDIRSRFVSKYGDFITYYQILEAFRIHPNKAQFCTNYLLDIRVMNEILNISTQLVDIVESMGVRAAEGGPTPHIFAALSAGLIDYICVRQTPYRYRSITSSAVYIHPGSTLFAKSPEFIIAGEIVTTRKTFARSVSPFKKEWLEYIPTLYAQQLTSYAKKAKKRRPSRSRKFRR